MRNSLIVLLAVAALPFFSACKDKKKTEQTASTKQDILTGTVRIAVDEAILPLVQEQIEVFESSYTESKLLIESLPEIKAVNFLLQDSANLAILTRQLTEAEGENFRKRQINPRIYQFASDAVVFIKNLSAADTSLQLKSVNDIMTGASSANPAVKLVFDNANGSNLRFLKDYFKLEKINSKGITALNSNEEVLKFISENPSATGVISLSWLLQAGKKNVQYLDKIRTLSLLNEKDGNYYRANQTTLALDKYPLTRPVYILNYQASQGLGLGFSAFLTGDRGQRIVLKAGLLPATMPGREIYIREE